MADTEVRKAYFNLSSNKIVLLTDTELVEEGMNRFVSLVEWKEFCKRNVNRIYQDIDYLFNTGKPYYTIKSNIGVASYNTYNNFEDAFNAAAVNLYLEERSKNNV